MKNKSIPIAVFAFNRPDHLRLTLQALAENDLASQSSLTIFCDGPRSAGERVLTDAVRMVAKSATGFMCVTVVERDCNMGCADSIINGLTQMFVFHDRVIVVEDDILLSPHALRYFELCLEAYEHCRALIAISAWSPPLGRVPDDYPFDVYCIPRFNCWGWATWRDRWQSVDWAISGYDEFRRNRVLRDAFSQGGEDVNQLLEMQLAGQIDSWAIRMDYSRFKQGLLSLNPVISYSTNIGIGSGTHTTQATSRYDNDVTKSVSDPRLPGHVFVDSDILKAYQKFYARPGMFDRVVNKLWRTIFA